MRIRYIGRHDEVELFYPGSGLTCAHGAVVEVPDAAAGRPPAANWRDVHAELGAARESADPDRIAAALAAVDALDLGEGLLAQDENWEPADTAKRPVKTITEPAPEG